MDPKHIDIKRLYCTFCRNGGENMCKQCQSEGVADDYSLLNENQVSQEV